MSNLEEARKLKQTLLNEYGHFSNKRITKLDVGSRLIVDGRTINDIGANGQIYSSFCSMFLDVLSGDEVLLSLMNCPTNPDIERWFAANAISFGHNGKSISIMKGEQDCIMKLRLLFASLPVGAVNMMSRITNILLRVYQTRLADCALRSIKHGR